MEQEEHKELAERLIAMYTGILQVHFKLLYTSLCDNDCGWTKG